jgi:hypothetical protein
VTFYWYHETTSCMYFQKFTSISLSTLITAIRILSCVCSLVWYQDVWLKLFPHWLQLWGFSLVCPLVNSQMARWSKTFHTLITAIRFLSCVRSPVYSQTARCNKFLLTLITAIRFLSCVCSLMYLQAAWVSKPFPTLITAKKFLSSVNSLV